MQKDWINELVWWAGIILLALILLPALWTKVFGEEPVAYLSTSEAEVVDGDTIRAIVHLGAGINLDRQKIRASNFDAWEASKARRSKPFKNFTSDQWEAEIAKGEKAKRFLQGGLESGRLFVVLENKRDSYGRLLGRFYLYLDERLIDVADEMKTNGHTRR